MGNKYPWEGVGVDAPCWHIHHNALLEWSIRPLDMRAEFIRAHKPEGEIELRLRLMRPVKGILPEVVVKAWAAYDKRYKKWNAFVNALVAYRAEIEALHAKECPDCSWDGKTIFPAVKEVEEAKGGAR